MDQTTPMVAKKIWNIMRVAFLMLRKGICKRKILMDLNLVMKRGKIAGKAFQKLMSHHHHDNHHDSISKVGLDGESKPEGEYEFSCSNTPLYTQYFTNNNKTKKHHIKNYSIDDDIKNIEAVNNMFDLMMTSSHELVVASPSPSPSPLLGLGLGFGRSPAVRQLRVTDSPFPLQNGEDDKHVDAAADEFIKRFYSQLKQQKYY